MAAMANTREVFRGSYEKVGIAHEKFTWVVWIGGEDHTVIVRRHFRKKLEFDGSKVPVRWQAYGVNFYMQYKYFPSETVKLFVNNIEFKDLPDVTSRPRGALMAAAATVTCANCGNAGHHARGCAMPSNGIIYDSDEERRRKDAKEIKKTKQTFGEMAGELLDEFLS